MTYQKPTIRAIALTARKRLEAHAAQRHTTPPAVLIDPDGGPSDALMKYCDDHGLTLDWALLGRGPMDRRLLPSGRPSPVTGMAYDLSGLIEACRIAAECDSVGMPAEFWGISQTLRVISRMAYDMIEAVEGIEGKETCLSPAIKAALQATTKTRKSLDAALARFDEMENSKGTSDAEMTAFQASTVHPAHDANDAAEQALVDTPAVTLGDFLQKVALLCREGENPEIYDGLRNEAKHLIEVFA